MKRVPKSAEYIRVRNKTFWRFLIPTSLGWSIGMLLGLVSTHRGWQWYLGETVVFLVLLLVAVIMACQTAKQTVKGTDYGV